MEEEFLTTIALPTYSIALSKAIRRPTEEELWTETHGPIVLMPQ